MAGKQPRPVRDIQEKERLKEQDDYLEEALEETFPASDPIAPSHPTSKKIIQNQGTTREMSA